MGGGSSTTDGRSGGGVGGASSRIGSLGFTLCLLRRFGGGGGNSHQPCRHFFPPPWPLMLRVRVIAVATITGLGSSKSYKGHTHQLEHVRQLRRATCQDTMGVCKLKATTKDSPTKGGRGIFRSSVGLGGPLLKRAAIPSPHGTGRWDRCFTSGVEPDSRSQTPRIDHALHGFKQPCAGASAVDIPLPCRPCAQPRPLDDVPAAVRY